MDVHDHKPEKPPLGLGIGVAVIGLYFALIGFGVLPVPGGEGNLHGPLWLVVGAGLVFLFGGAALVLQWLGRANAHGELAPDAPAWMKAAQSLLMIGILLAFAMIGSWIAFARGERSFSGNVSLSGAAGEMVGRVAFGIGAVICWVFVIVLIVRARKKFFSNKDRTPRDAGR